MTFCGFAALVREELPAGKPKFTEDDLPDLTGQVIIVTGGNSGIGRVTTRALLKHNAKVYIASRSQAKVEEAIKALKEETGKDSVHFLKLDLADLKSVKAAAEDFLQRESQLHVLYNNGGVMVPPLDDLTVDGYDLQFGTNVLGHFYFTKLLLPVLLATAKTSPQKSVRVVHTSSDAQWFSNIHYDTLRDGPARRKYGTEQLYAQSKNGNVVFSNELARRYGDQGIISVSLNPGILKTELQRNLTGMQEKIVNKILKDVNVYGATSTLYAGFSPEGAALNGQYIIPWARLGRARGNALDPKDGQKLWDWLDEQVSKVA
ncbi:hypothetical protein PLICRDRAFT_48258 [Plicaturopsis crispa FD-325 SS-3]|nr:hypothetical protein PLICRDRAFT_48258 [Plicaturopsis crispa FD-325 SS-3]